MQVKIFDYNDACQLIAEGKLSALDIDFEGNALCIYCKGLNYSDPYDSTTSRKQDIARPFG